MERKRKNRKLLRLLHRNMPQLRHLKCRYEQYVIDSNGKDYYKIAITKALSSELRAKRLPTAGDGFGGFLIELNNTCNLKCAMCNTHLAHRPKRNMELATFSRLLDRIDEYGANLVSFHTVGEPLMYPHLREAVAIARAKNIEVGISSNAVLTERLVAIHESDPAWVHGFRFSIDAATPETYRKIRVGGELANVLQSCEFVNQTNKGRINSRLALAVNCVVGAENAGEMATFFHTFTKYAFPMHLRFGLMNSLSPDTSYYRENRIEFKNLYKSNVPCGMVFGGMYFNNEGHATLCCRDYENQLVIGNPLESSLREVWRSPAAESIRRQHRQEEEMTIEQCRNCFGPKSGAGKAVNHFLHYLWQRHPDKDDRFWHDRLMDFMADMDVLFANLNEEGINRFVGKHIV